MGGRALPWRFCGASTSRVDVAGALPLSSCVDRETARLRLAIVRPQRRCKECRALAHGRTDISSPVVLDTDLYLLLEPLCLLLLLELVLLEQLPSREGLRLILLALHGPAGDPGGWTTRMSSKNSNRAEGDGTISSYNGLMGSSDKAAQDPSLPASQHESPRPCSIDRS
jgi:hypothetical protein